MTETTLFKNDGSFAEKAGEQASDSAGFVETFCQSALHAGLERPYNGLSQLVNAASQSMLGKDVLPYMTAVKPPHEKFGTGNWVAHNLGEVAGIAADFGVLSGAVGLAAKPFIKTTTAESIAMMKLEMSPAQFRIGQSVAAGALYEGVFSATEGKHLGVERLKNAGIGGLTFGVLTGLAEVAGSAINRRLISQGAHGQAEAALLTRALSGTSAGFAGGAGAGFINAEATAIGREGRPANLEEISNSIIQFGLTGGVFGLAGGLRSASLYGRPSEIIPATENLKAGGKTQPVPELSAVVGGDKPIGVAYMDSNKGINVRISLTSENGAVGDIFQRYPKSHPQYRGITRFLGELKPNEGVRIGSWPFLQKAEK